MFIHLHVLRTVPTMLLALAMAISTGLQVSPAHALQVTSLTDGTADANLAELVREIPVPRLLPAAEWEKIVKRPNVFEKNTAYSATSIGSTGGYAPVASTHQVTRRNATRTANTISTPTTQTAQRSKEKTPSQASLSMYSGSAPHVAPTVQSTHTMPVQPATSTPHAQPTAQSVQPTQPTSSITPTAKHQASVPAAQSVAPVIPQPSTPVVTTPTTNTVRQPLAPQVHQPAEPRVQPPSEQAPSTVPRSTPMPSSPVQPSAPTIDGPPASLVIPNAGITLKPNNGRGALTDTAVPQ